MRHTANGRGRYDHSDDDDQPRRRTFHYEYIHSDRPKPQPFVPAGQKRKLPKIVIPSSSSSSDEDISFPVAFGQKPLRIGDPFPMRRERLPSPGRRRKAVRKPDGSVSAYEEVVDPEDVRASSEARTAMIREYSKWDNDRITAEMKREKRQQRHDETMSRHQLYTDENFLNHRLQMEQERNRHEMELMQARREQEIEDERWIQAISQKLDQQEKAKKDLVFARTPNIFGQLLQELNATPDNLRGNGVLTGFCRSRSSLYHGYLYTMLFYGVDRVIRPNKKKEEITVFYNTKLPEKVSIARPGMTTRPVIYSLQSRQMCIVDVIGHPKEEKSFIEKLCPTKCNI